jgi:F-type H+-transporting ATPase subunit delta
MADIRAVSRYIKALLGLAVEKGALEQVHQDMILFSKVCAESRDFTAMLKSPVIRHEKKAAIMQKLFVGKMNAITLAFIDIITKKNREPILLAIATGFHPAYNEFKGIGEATITTTIPLDAELRKEMEEIVKKLSDKKQVEIKEKVNKELIGGFILQVGSRQVDASINNKLKALKLKFLENHFVKES